MFVLAMMAVMGVMLALPPSVAQLDGAGRRAEVGPLFRQALQAPPGSVASAPMPARSPAPPPSTVPTDAPAPAPVPV